MTWCATGVGERGCGPAPCPCHFGATPPRSNPSQLASIASGQLIPLEFLKPFFEANNPGHADALRMATERHFELGRRVTH